MANVNCWLCEDVYVYLWRGECSCSEEGRPFGERAGIDGGRPGDGKPAVSQELRLRQRERESPHQQEC